MLNPDTRIGQKKDKGDKIFGGADLDMMEAKNLGVSFKDIAGISEIKEEIKVSSLGSSAPA